MLFGIFGQLEEQSFNGNCHELSLRSFFRLFPGVHRRVDTGVRERLGWIGQEDDCLAIWGEVDLQPLTIGPYWQAVALSSFFGSDVGLANDYLEGSRPHCGLSIWGQQVDLGGDGNTGNIRQAGL